MAVTKKMFCVYDLKAEVFSPPMFFLTKGEALRTFAEVASDKNHQIGKYPADYVMYEVGSFNDLRAKFDIFDVPVALGAASDFIKSE